ncbi:hypothetical protein GOTRE_026_01310 [Gordonia terrae NBRC 100016]|uniref:Transposase n=1 Tax=Gordonia terrae NBRC 100016 TaxID=1089454 RepID=A0ABQ0HAF9_9ACTN|nr:hypothetical protein GOTRE_026_01310 [Gordonia terrae NBRC 100016]
MTSSDGITPGQPRGHIIRWGTNRESCKGRPAAQRPDDRALVLNCEYIKTVVPDVAETDGLT